MAAAAGGSASVGKSDDNVVVFCGVCVRCGMHCCPDRGGCGKGLSFVGLGSNAPCCGGQSTLVKPPWYNRQIVGDDVMVYRACNCTCTCANVRGELGSTPCRIQNEKGVCEKWEKRRDAGLAESRRQRALVLQEKLQVMPADCPLAQREALVRAIHSCQRSARM